MESFLTQLLSGADGLGAYALVFSILLACGLGLPIPEDISLVLGGYLAYKGAVDLPVMMLVGFAGILVGDSLIYMAGRRIGSNVGTRGGFFARVVTPEKRAKVEGLFLSHGDKIVMIARFLPGVRAVTYFTAGSARMAFGRFLLFDGIAAIASAPLFVFLGFRFGGELDRLIDRVRDGQLVALGLLVTAGIAFFWLRWRSRPPTPSAPA
ncbi:MAG: DedA family protein [Myxococcaceae bacterium]